MDPYTSEVVEAYRKTESAVANEYANVPEKELLTQKILDKFLHAFKEPPIQDFEFVLQRKISPGANNMLAHYLHLSLTLRTYSSFFLR